MVKVVEEWTLGSGFRMKVLEHRPEPHPGPSSIEGKWKWNDEEYDLPPKQAMDKAALAGKELHTLFEHGVDALMGGASKPPVPKKYQKLYGETMAWIKRQQWKDIIGKELPVYHPDYIYAGTLDLLVVNKKDELEVVDWKTGDMREWLSVKGRKTKKPGPYDARKFVKAGEQIAAYAKAYEAMTGKLVKKITCANPCRATNKFETAVTYKHIDYLFKGFLLKLEAWKHENFNRLTKGFKRPGCTTVYKWPMDLVLKDFYKDFIERSK